MDNNLVNYNDYYCWVLLTTTAVCEHVSGIVHIKEIDQ